jgi:hypothetical protein
MDGTADLVQQLLRVVEQQQASIHSQQQAIGRLGDLLERTTATLPVPEPAPPAADKEKAEEKPESLRRKPVDWLQVSGRERLAAWQGLAYFVEVLVYRYNLQMEVRPCWWQHSDVVEELTALWHTRQMSYRDDADLNAAYTWQDALYKARDRLRFMFVACLEAHVDQTIDGVWMDDETRNAFVQQVQRDVLGSTGGKR